MADERMTEQEIDEYAQLARVLESCPKADDITDAAIALLVLTREVRRERVRVADLEAAFAGAARHDVRPEVAAFAEVVERQLRKNDEAKGERGWKGARPLALLAHLCEELYELVDLFGPDPTTLARDWVGWKLRLAGWLLQQARSAL